MREFTFKPAMIGADQTWALKDGYLMRKGADRAIKLSEVTRASWNDMTLRGERSTWLHLTDATGVVKVEGSDSGGETNREILLSLVRAVLEDLEQEAPTLEVRIDGGDAVRRATFIIFAIATLAGLFFFYAGTTGMVVRGAVWAMLGGGLGAAFAGYMAWTYAPWRDAVYMAPGDLSRLIEQGG